jgi:hypothetical protein
MQRGIQGALLRIARDLLSAAPKHPSVQRLEQQSQGSRVDPLRALRQD